MEQKYDRRKARLEKQMADLEIRREKALARQRRYDARFAKETAEVPGHFAHGINFYKLCWVFFICCFLGVYFCSWLQETVTGTVSWDYSGMPFNLNGRINLLYCLFWGVLALVWVKEIYPRISGWIEQNVSRTYGVALTWVIVVFMLLNSLVSGAAVLRMAQRYEGVPATSAWQQLMDRYYPDEKLAKIYPSMTHTN